jgi:hypothetical protein
MRQVRAGAWLCFWFCSFVVLGQTNRGGISGNVTDASGAVVPSAAITITNLGTGEVRHLQTNGNGSYVEQNLEPVTYKVEIAASGFKKFVLERVKVDTSTVATANIRLEPGNVSTQVTVEATVPLVNSESGTLATTITQRLLTDVPLANRSVLDLAVSVPNVTGDVGTEDPQVTSQTPVPGYNLNINGGRSGSTRFLADGVNNTGVGLAREAVAFSPETVQEFTVQTNAFSAEYGTSGGGVISVTTKSGTNDFNGMALWYFRNPVLNAAPYTEAAVNRPVSNLRWNQFDGQLGGPVILPKLYNGRNKTFFFFAGEPRYQSDRLQTTADLPTSAMRSGDFSNVVAINGSGTAGGGGWVPSDIYNQFKSSAAGAFNPSASTTIYQHYNLAGNQLLRLTAPAAGYAPFPGNKIPASMLDPTAVKLINNYLPPAGSYFIDSNGYIDNYNTYRFVSDNETRYNLRLDQIVSNTDHIYFRMTKIPETGIKGFDANYPANGNGATFSDSQQYMADYTRTFTATLFNDLRLAYTRGNFSNGNGPQYDINSGQNLNTELGLPSFTKGGLPMFSFGLDSFGNIGSQGSTSNQNLEQQYEIADTVYLNRGAMTWKLGFDFSKSMLNSLSFYALDGGNYSFAGTETNSNGGASGTGGIAAASFLLGVPHSVALYNTVIPYYYRWKAYAGFVQNDWKVKPNLTLNLGLRYSLQLPRTEKYNHQGTFDPSKAISVPIPGGYTIPYINQTITSASEIPFAFNGYGGRGPYLTPISWLGFEPRFGFAYQPHFWGMDKWVVRGGYALSHAPITGNNRLPIPNFAAGAPAINETRGNANPTYVTRLSSNPPAVPYVPVNSLLGLDNNSSGLLYGQAIAFPAYVLTGENSVPYVQNWNVSIQRELGNRSMIELAYVGTKGTHLYTSNTNLNNPNVADVLAFQAAGQNPTTANITDPLGRKTANGADYVVSLNSLVSPYFGYGTVSTLLDASGNSTRHAGFINFVRRQSPGLSLIANYTFGKSIDDGSDANPDKGTLSTSNVGGGEYAFGGARSLDRSVSVFDIRHQLNTTFIYDLPFGEGRHWGSHAWYPLRFALGGWTASGVERFYSGYPLTVNMADGNFISSITHGMRPDLIAGAPLVNPLYDSNCRTSASCQPYVNPAAFARPPYGELGSTPRTLDAVRGPMQQTFDISVQKTWNVGESGKHRIQFRMDMINAFNHPTFRLPINSGGGTDVFNATGGYPNFTVTKANVTSYYTTWQASNPSAAGPSSAQGQANINNLYNSIAALENASGVLPANFYSVSVPQGFALQNASSFNLLDPSLNGFKLNQLRTGYSSGFGTLGYSTAWISPRYIQLGLRIFF